MKPRFKYPDEVAEHVARRASRTGTPEDWKCFSDVEEAIHDIPEEHKCTPGESALCFSGLLGTPVLLGIREGKHGCEPGFFYDLS